MHLDSAHTLTTHSQLLPVILVSRSPSWFRSFPLCSSSSALNSSAPSLHRCPVLLLHFSTPFFRFYSQQCIWSSFHPTYQRWWRRRLEDEERSGKLFQLEAGKWVQEDREEEKNRKRSCCSAWDQCCSAAAATTTSPVIPPLSLSPSSTSSHLLVQPSLFLSPLYCLTDSCFNSHPASLLHHSFFSHSLLHSHTV